VTDQPEFIHKPNHSAVSLRIFGDALDPVELTNLLKCQPSQSHRKGDYILRRDGSTIWNDSTGRYSMHKTGRWSLKAATSEPADIESQMRVILAQLPSNPEIWDTISQKFGFKIEFFCGYFMRRGNEDLVMSAAILKELSQRHIQIWFDMYSAIEEELREAREFYEQQDANSNPSK
jgi:Domain of unknown function (DUF4279)